MGPPDGSWNWKHGEPVKSEWTVASIDVYNGTNAYLTGLSQTPVRSLEDVVRYEENTGTESATPGIVPAFHDGQLTFLEIFECRGNKFATYHAALDHIHMHARQELG